MPIETHFQTLDKIPIERIEEWLTRDKIPPISEETARAVYAKFLNARRTVRAGGHNGGSKSGAQWYIDRGLPVPAQLPQRKAKTSKAKIKRWRGTPKPKINLERRQILEALEETKGHLNLGDVANVLGIDRKTLSRRMEKYGIPKP